MTGRRDHIDALGTALLIAVSANLGLNQALIKLVNAGMSPAFQAGMRSACAIVPMVGYMLWRGRKIRFDDGSLLPGTACGILFATEFYLLFGALDRTTVSRSAVLFYTMPVWVALGAHFLIPGERLTPQRVAGLLLAVAGVAVAMLRPSAVGTSQEGMPASVMLTGDLMALAGATGWAAIAILARTTRLAKASPEMQLVYQLAVSAPILLALAWAGGDTFREMTPLLWGAFGYQVIGVVAVGFTVWFWLLSVYPASGMASYAFLTPLFGVLFGWLMFGEQLTAGLVIALALVGAGIWLVNRK